ncbi:Cloroperoxidase [Xylariaceae sp. AK1471]|nr:Cloroperoxidase [Xylariaceae sp. AK1471]
MKFTTLIAAAVLGSSTAQASCPFSDNWEPAGPGDVRAPCPMLNTLANHGFLPHSGKDITESVVVKAFGDVLNFDPVFSKFLHSIAILGNPVPNATTFSLNDLDEHNKLEHDSSLSRADAYWGDAISFNQSIFDQTKVYWTDSIVDLESAAMARLARLKFSNETNPTFSTPNVYASTGETSVLMLTFSNGTLGFAHGSMMRSFFEHERLPCDLGWTKPDVVISEDSLVDMISRLNNATAMG